MPVQDPRIFCPGPQIITGYAMDLSSVVRESAAFTRATLAGNPVRWLAFILLGLPWTLLTTVAESSRILEGTTIHWSQIPWNEMGLLICTGILCNLFLTGYIVRLLEGAPVPPEFDTWPRLCLDGMKVHVIPLVWILVPSVLALLEYLISSGGLLPAARWGSTPGTVLLILLILIQLVILFIAVQYGFIGAVRFARTGSVREAFALNEIRKTLGRIGLVNYYLGLGVLALVWLAFNAALTWLSLVPRAGPFAVLALGPFLTVFCVRFIAHSCDDAFPAASGETGASGRSDPVSLRAMMPEMLLWAGVLALLFVLCFTPLALVAGSVSGFFLR